MQNDIAVVGMVCRVPGADDLSSFWEMLASGREGLRTLTTDEMQSASGQPDTNHVYAGGYIPDIDLFDAEYFSLSANEVTMMDPQQRLWLQACQALLEITGHAAQEQQYIGVFASMGPNSYLHKVLSSQATAEQTALLGNVPDCLATRVAYKLGLTGPSMTIQSGCSSSLVGVHQARLALLTKQCDAALVGGICVILPHNQGYTYIEGGFASPDGHCRPFSNDANGTVLSSGYGVMMLKRLSDAVAAGDTIYAVIKGSAINNDGADKASFTAPSVNGQAAVIAKALRVSGLSSNDIQYVEAHGTATPIGDPIELAALEQSLNLAERQSGSCFLGSVKANVGHLDVAAGIIGLIKTCLMLHHKQIPPQIHFKEWNPKYRSSAFEICQTLRSWVSQDKRRAGVSAFGFGGTNAHIILEEAPEKPMQQVSILGQLIILSAPSKDKLLEWVSVLKVFLKNNPDISLESLAVTLQIGRKQYLHRLSFVSHSIAELVAVLGRVEAEDIVSSTTCDNIFTVDRSTSTYEIQKAWHNGKQLNWQNAYIGQRIQKIALPPMPLKLARYWIDDVPARPIKCSMPSEHIEPSASIYQPVWQERPVMPSMALMAMQPLLIVSTERNELIDALIDYLELHHILYYLVTHADTYQRVSAYHWHIDQSNALDYQQLIKDWLNKEQLPVACFIYLSIDQLSPTREYPQNIIFNLLQLNQMMRNLKYWSTVVMNMTHLHCVDNHGLNSILIGLCRSVGQEFSNIRMQLLDLDAKETPDKLVSQIIKTVTTSELSDLCVWRSGRCWQQAFQPLPSISTPISEPYFKKNGVYLITGGLGDVASVYVEFLAREYQAELLLVGRSQLPDESTWSSLISSGALDVNLHKKIMRVQQWRHAGYNVHLLSADVGDHAAMRRLCQKACERHAKIDGIIHIAGASSDMHYKTLPELTWNHCWQLFAPKLLGIDVLGRIAQEFGIENCVMISSVSSCLTGIGLGAYGASHNLLDALVEKHHPAWKIMNWDAWNFYQTEQSKQYGALGAQIDKLAIKKEQGIKILQYIFNYLCEWQQVFISLADLNARYDYWAHRGFLAQISVSKTRHPRPTLLNEYSAPVSLWQQNLADAWGFLLGIDKIGIHDNFFELGGHSLLALEFIQYLKTEYNESCSVIDLFSAPTIIQFEAKLQRIRSQQSNHIQDRISKQLAVKRTRKIKGLAHVNE